MGETDFTLGAFAFEQEFCGLDFGDVRLNRRFVQVIEGIYKNPGSVIQRTQGTWSEMMGAYRLFDNDRVEVTEILRAHREQTIARMSLYDRVLAIQDTTSICYSSHLSTQGLGSIGMGAFGTKGKGILLHTTMATTLDGVPLGILEQTMWSRGILKKGDELYASERIRWLKGIKSSASANFTEVIFVGDREADGLDYFAVSQREGISFVVRAKEKMRKFEDENGRSVSEFLRTQPVAGKMSLQIRYVKKGSKKHRPRESREAELTARFGEVRLRPSPTLTISPDPTAEERTVRAILVEEVNPPKGADPICWLLFTNLWVGNLQQAREILEIYKIRWEIETFHKILKSACKVEGAQLESADRLKRLITALSIVAWRLHVLTKEQRERPDAPCTEILTDLEWKTLYLLEKKAKKIPQKPPTLREAVLWIAKLGKFIGRKGDGEPGPLTLYRGWQKLIHCTEMHLVMQDVYKR